MANIGHGKKYEINRRKLLFSAAKLFLEQGYTNTSIKEIATSAKTSVGAFLRIFGTKEHILAELVRYVINGQFEVTKKLLEEKCDDKILFYAAETALQLHMAESSENIRELYGMAYSLPLTTDIIQHTITEKLENIFKEHLPNLETKDFFELEIASGGIMRGFMTVPCDMYFTMKRKVRRFLETTFLVYRVSDEKIKEAIEFVEQFDFEKIAEETINAMVIEVSQKA